MLSQLEEGGNRGEPGPGCEHVRVIPGTSRMECAGLANMMAAMDEREGTHSGTPAGTSMEEPAPQSPGRRPLRRRAGHRLVAGVAGGLADYAGMRPLVFRLVFVVFAFLGGIGILIYLLLWWLIPREDLPDSAAERLVRRFPNAPSWVGIALLGLGMILLAGHLSAVRFPALALLVLGVGLLVGAFVGRARWLILPGLLLVPIVLAASLIDVPLEGGVHEIHAFPQAPQAIAGSYRVAAGSIYLDLTSLTGTAAAPVIAASTGIGDINVLVPYDAHVVATGKAGVGIVTIGPFSTDRGLDRSLRRTWQPRYGDGATITLDLQTGVGDIWVGRRDPTRNERKELKAR